ncbi:hypothetical protein J2Z24_003741 [Clostridium tetanomorphum]|nr:hypothetical protein [Clostridium tetanomorphum]
MRLKSAAAPATVIDDEPLYTTPSRGGRERLE